MKGAIEKPVSTRRPRRLRLLVGFSIGAALGLDFAVAIVSMIDIRNDLLPLPGEVVIFVALALLGGATGYWIARARRR